VLRWIGDAGRSAESTGAYLVPLLISNALFGVLALVLLLLQPGWLNPLGFGGLRWDLALHTTISFLTNTDQHHLIPEETLGNLAQLGALQFLMFVSAASGLAVGFAVIRGFSGRPIGNFSRDLLRSLTRVLIPASVLLALFFLVSGVPMTLAPPRWRSPPWRGPANRCRGGRSRCSRRSSSWVKTAVASSVSTPPIPTRTPPCSPTW
jgi:K+-transporting ATPase ATPase A chain